MQIDRSLTTGSSVPEPLLTSTETKALDDAAVASGLSYETLMRNAARAVADVAAAMVGSRAIAVLAGAGNNGGDAYGAAVLLRQAGWRVAVFAASPSTAMKGAAATMAAEWGTEPEPLDAFEPERFALTIDGLFGAGLSRPPDGATAAAIAKLNASKARVLAIDLPSGVCGEDGRILGDAPRAEGTVTFGTRKPGHLLLPGRARCGVVEVADIGFPNGLVAAQGARTFANTPGLFARSMLRPDDVHHKYDRGHAVVFSGPASQTGAARLSALAALRGGAGIVTMFSPVSAVLVNAAHLTAIMLRRCESVEELSERLGDERLKTFVLGPGFGDVEKAGAFAAVVLHAGRALVLDADGLTAFADRPQSLFDAAAGGRLVLTPHDGEFERLFPDLSDRPSKLDRARLAAERAGAVVVLKGSDTVIADPDGRAAINVNGTSALATAGTGDVLTGLVAAQLASGVPSFEAACAAVWIHAEAARRFGPGLIAEDLPGLVPAALRDLQSSLGG